MPFARVSKLLARGVMDKALAWCPGNRGSIPGSPTRLKVAVIRMFLPRALVGRIKIITK